MDISTASVRKASLAVILLSMSLSGNASAEPVPEKSPSGSYIPVISLENALKKVSSQTFSAEELQEIRTEAGRKTYLLPASAAR